MKNLKYTYIAVFIILLSQFISARADTWQVIFSETYNSTATQQNCYYDYSINDDVCTYINQGTF